MAYDAHKNFGYSTVATAPVPALSGTSLVVFAGDGGKFPTVPFNATIWPANTQPTTANAEIVRVTNISTDTFTITRAQETSNAQSVAVTYQIAATITAKTLTDVENPTYITTPASAPVLYGCVGGRLTLTTGSAVPPADVTGATTVYFTPYSASPFCGNIGLYDGTTTWTVLPFAEISVALGTLTSGLPYDVFAYNNAGVVALRAPVAWTNGTTRATALATQNGVLVKTGATTDRYLGTFYTDSTTATSDSGAGAAGSGRHLYNYYNRVRRPVLRLEATATWAYSTATIRQANGSTANQVQVMIGVAEGLVDLSLFAMFDNVNPVAVGVGIGENSTTVISPSNTGGGGNNTGLASGYTPLIAHLSKVSPLGHNVYAWLEYSTGATTNWYGSPGAPSSPTGTANGLTGWAEV